LIQAAGPGFQGTRHRSRSGDAQQYPDKRLSSVKRKERIKMKKTQNAGKGSASRIKADAQRVKKGGEQ